MSQQSTIPSPIQKSVEKSPADLLSMFITQNQKGSTVTSIGPLSEVESSILRSTMPININETEEITVLGQRGVWANKEETINWKGVIPIESYSINQDENPEIIMKRFSQKMNYVQELAIRYLRPTTPTAPGDILITQESNILTSPAPPLIIRQQPARPVTPEPVVIREAPPKAPPVTGVKKITISGKKLPPPPRKVVIERLAPLPNKPQSIIIERWLPYKEQSRRVVFKKPVEPDMVVIKPKNVIIQWESPKVIIKQETKYLGVITANPEDYVQKYGTNLKKTEELPEFVRNIQQPDGLTLASDYKYQNIPKLEGNIEALKLINLEQEGLAEYKPQLEEFISSRAYESNEQATDEKKKPNPYASPIYIQQIFSHIDTDMNGEISESEARSILLRINSRLDKNYGEDDVKLIFKRLDKSKDGVVNFEEFKNLFKSLL